MPWNRLHPAALLGLYWLLLVAPFSVAVNPYILPIDEETDRYGVFYRNSYGQKGRYSAESWAKARSVRCVNLQQGRFAHPTTTCFPTSAFIPNG